jgi:hypothetical protein
MATSMGSYSFMWTHAAARRGADLAIAASTRPAAVACQLTNRHRAAQGRCCSRAFGDADALAFKCFEKVLHNLQRERG